MTRFLVAGLGNIGEEYADTRHNAGFLIADELVRACNGKFLQDRLASVAEVKYKGRQVIVIKPATYMNLSGKAVVHWMQAEKIVPENLLVLVDEIALPFGKIRLGQKGSDGGHNGLKSVQESLGTHEYPRLRFGIGNEFSRGSQVNFVLGRWDDEEKKTLQQRVMLAADAVRAFVFTGLQRAMNEYNTR